MLDAGDDWTSLEEIGRSSGLTNESLVVTIKGSAAIYAEGVHVGPGETGSGSWDEGNVRGRKAALADGN